MLLDIVREKSTGRFYIAGFDALIRVKQTKLQKLYLEIFQVSTYWRKIAVIIRDLGTGHVTKSGGGVFLKRDADVDEGPMIE